MCPIFSLSKSIFHFLVEERLGVKELERNTTNKQINKIGRNIAIA